MTTYAYLRISMGKQDEAGQRSTVERLAALRGFKVDEWVIETESRGKKWQARALGALFERMQQGDILLIPEVSRIGASIGGILSLMEIAVERGLSVHCAEPDIILDNSLQASVLAFAFGLASRIERQLIQHRTKAALRARQEAGVKLGRPFGASGRSKLDQHLETIKALVAAGTADAAIGRFLHCSRHTVKAFRIANKIGAYSHD